MAMMGIRLLFLSVLFVLLFLFCCSALGTSRTPRDSPATPIDLTKWRNKKVMLISAHPDDIEAGAGGTVALLTRQGTEVFFAIVTNGDKGCANPICLNASSQQIAVMRRQEAYNAAKVLGVPASNVFQLDYEDGMVTSYPQVQIKTDLLSYARRVQPDVVLTWNPFPNFNLLPNQGWTDLGYHPDHQAVGHLALEVQFDVGVGLLYPNLGPAHSVSEFYMFEFWAPRCYVDISSTLDKKIAAFLEHKTQYPDPALVKYGLTELAGRIANETSAPVTYAEGFIAYW
jgi:LmbE family N-acetylglucosaminyl deacetylase